MLDFAPRAFEASGRHSFHQIAPQDAAEDPRHRRGDHLPGKDQQRTPPSAEENRSGDFDDVARGHRGDADEGVKARVGDVLDVAVRDIGDKVSEVPDRTVVPPRQMPEEPRSAIKARKLAAAARRLGVKGAEAADFTAFSIIFFLTASRRSFIM
ncbi:MAG: hypothetical protein M5R36_02955 [Deltaproteobacteria bacterium]|nr:hypothetical protein [Deltaproteobacteria bacterium]